MKEEKVQGILNLLKKIREWQEASKRIPFILGRKKPPWWRRLLAGL